MPETAESHVVSLTTNRNCTIEITNLSSINCLVNPKVYMESGFCFSPPQPTVRTNTTEVCSFTKDDNTASGAVGVMTYELFDMRNRHCKELLAVMFSVPYDYNVYKNWFALGIYPKDKECNESLYKEMYYSKEQQGFIREEANGSGLTFEGKQVDIMATMSPMGKAIMKLELWDKMFTPTMTQSPY